MDNKADRPGTEVNDSEDISDVEAQQRLERLERSIDDAQTDLHDILLAVKKDNTMDSFKIINVLLNVVICLSLFVIGVGVGDAVAEKRQSQKEETSCVLYVTVPNECMSSNEQSTNKP